MEQLKEKSSNCEEVKECKNCKNCAKKEVEIKELRERLKISENKNKELNKDNKQMKYMLTQSNRLNVSKDIKIEQLEKQFSAKPQINPVQFNELVFSRFGNIFSEQELASLRSIPALSSRDSSFILLTVRTLYKEDL